MAKLRHIAINTQDLEGQRAFFCDVFGLKEVGRAGSEEMGAIYLSDGVMNLALIKIPDPDYPNYAPQGLNHIGFVVDDLDATIDAAQAGGAVSMVDRDHRDAGATWEMKMRAPGGVQIDLSDHGWPGITL